MTSTPPQNGVSHQPTAATTAVKGSSGVELQGVYSDSEIDQLHQKLVATFNSGRTRPLEWRVQQLKQLRLMITENEKAWQDALYADLHKGAFEAWLNETNFVATEIDVTLKHLSSWVKPTKVSGNLLALPSSNYIYHDPLGTVLVIAPFNYPLQLLAAPWLGAIAAGNCAILKPSEMTPHTSNLLAQLTPRYMDTDAFVVVNGGVKETTALLEKEFQLIFYTGNGKVARIVMKAASKNLTPVILELGGKSPTYISDTANIDLAAKRVMWGKWNNAGQTCIAPDYVLVHKKVAADFSQACQKYVQQFFKGNPKESRDYGRIVNETHTKRLLGLLEGSDATVLIGGKGDVQSRYVEPTILTNVSDSHKVMSEEIFGPILPIQEVDGTDDVIRRINSRSKPLALYVFSNDNHEIERILTNTSSGGSVVNDVIMHYTNHHLPFGGVGESGMGSYHGKKTFDSFTHDKSVMWRPGGAVGVATDVAQRYPPSSDFAKTVMQKVMSLQYWIT